MLPTNYSLKNFNYHSNDFFMNSHSSNDRKKSNRQILFYCPRIINTPNSLLLINYLKTLLFYLKKISPYGGSQKGSTSDLEETFSTKENFQQNSV